MNVYELRIYKSRVPIIGRKLHYGPPVNKNNDHRDYYIIIIIIRFTRVFGSRAKFAKGPAAEKRETTAAARRYTLFKIITYYT